MRTITFKSVFESISRMQGMDPRGDAVSSDAGLAISDNLNARVQTAWFAWEWPEWTRTEERAYRQIWNDSRQFYQAGADGKPDEVFYIPNVATHSLVDAAYYRVKEGGPGDPPVGTAPTNTTFWELMDTVDTYIAFDQICRRRIGEVLEVFADNPAICKPARCLNHRPTENGIQIYEAGGLATVFVRYLTPAEQFTTFPYIPSRTYLRGDTVYLASKGECYQAIQIALGRDPATETSYWRRCLFPAVLAQYVQLGTYADCLRESDTSDERDPVMLQIRGQRASQANADAEEEINRQINRLQAQGQHYQYLPFGVVVRRTNCGPAGCTIPGYVLQGGGAYNYGPIFPTGQGVTTINDQCETDGGTFTPPEPVQKIEGIMSGTVNLVAGQSYVDVVFGSVQPSANWVILETAIVNTDDTAPINVWPGVVTSKTTTGFRLQLNGLPDSANYVLNWSIMGSLGYFLSGPTTGEIGVASSAFTVWLPDESTLSGAVIITPHDGGVGGTFSPATVALTTGAPAATFTYRPSTLGARSIGTTNDRGLPNPASIGFNAIEYATGYSLSGPSSGTVGVASTPFTVTLTPLGDAVPSAVTVTPHDGGGGGTFTPTTVTLTTGAPSATFTYTPASTGAKTISTTNNGGLTDPGSLTYTVAFSPDGIAGLKVWLKADSLALADGTSVSTWGDSSSNANSATQTGAARPVFKTAIVNSLPVLRFSSASSQYMTLTNPIVTSSDWTVFVVGKKTSQTTGELCAMAATTDGECGPMAHTINYFTGHSGTLTPYSSVDGSFHVLSGTSTATFFIDGVSREAGTTLSIGGAASFSTVCRRGTNYSDGDVAEVLVYQGVLGTTDRQSVENYLMTKYAITAAFEPSVLAGQKLWLRADSLALADNATVTSWSDSSGKGNTMTVAGGTPKFRTAIVNGKPVVRFALATSDYIQSAGTVLSSQPNTWFFVAKETSKPNQCILLWTAGGNQNCYFNTSGFINFTAGTAQAESVDRSGAFHVISLVFAAGPLASMYVDGTLRVGPVNAGSNAPGNVNMWTTGSGLYSDGDMAEVILYNTALGTTDRQSVETYLKTKYAIP